MKLTIDIQTKDTFVIDLMTIPSDKNWFAVQWFGNPVNDYDLFKILYIKIIILFILWSIKHDNKITLSYNSLYS